MAFVAETADSILSQDESRWFALVDAIGRLAVSTSIDEIVDGLRRSSRQVAGSDGIAVVLRDGDFSFYAAEDAVGALWAGQRFPMQTCISGLAILNARTIVIPDVFIDPRVPHKLYARTFVKSMAMVPLGLPTPFGALGAYWSEAGMPLVSDVARLQALARAASAAFENLRLISSLRDMNDTLEAKVEARTSDLMKQIKEKEDAETKLKQVQRLEAVGQLTSGIAHDFNNLLTVILGNIAFLQRQFKAQNVNEKAMERLADMRTAAERGANLTKQMLAFSRKQPLATASVDLNKTLATMRGLLQSSLGGAIVIETSTPPDLWAAKVDPTQIELVILNLAINARDAMPTGGRLKIEAVNSSVIENGTIEDLAKGDYLVLSVTDTGTGMTDEIKAKAFEPFFTTKGPGHGSGLGLAQVYGFAKQSGGAVVIETRLGKGTSIKVFLPRAHRRPVLDTVLHGPADHLDTTIRPRVLLIDDDAAVRTITSTMLEDLGCEVVAVDTGPTAINLVRNGDRFDLVVLDYAMPVMMGTDVAKELSAINANLPMLFVTGYADRKLMSAFGPNFIVQKPFRDGEFESKVRDLIIGDLDPSEPAYAVV